MILKYQILTHTCSEYVVYPWAHLIMETFQIPPCLRLCLMSALTQPADDIEAIALPESKRQTLPEYMNT